MFREAIFWGDVCLVYYQQQYGAVRYGYKHLDNIFDYYDGVLVYEKEPNILCLAELGNGMLSDFIELDLSDSFTHIYSAYMLNRNEMIVGGDRPNFESFYYKLSCAEKR